MRLRLCFFLSSLFVFGFPLAVQKDGDSADLTKPDKALSVRDDADASQDTAPWTGISGGPNSPYQLLATNSQLLSTPDSPSKDSAGSPGLIPSTGSSLLAESLVDDIPGGKAAVDAAAAGTAGTAAYLLELFLNRADDVNFLLNDYPTDPNNVRIGVPKTEVEIVGGGKSNIPQVSAPGRNNFPVPPAVVGRCSLEPDPERVFPWCDNGEGSVAEMNVNGIAMVVVRGHECTLFPR